MKQIIKRLQKFEEYFLITCFALMGIVLTAQIFSRYALGLPIGWAEELARYLQIWITFLGIGFGIRKGSHISLNLIKEKMPHFLQYIASMIYLSLSIFVCSVVIYYCPIFLAQQDKLASTMKISLQVVYISIPFGFGIALIYLVVNLIKETQDFISYRRKKKC